MSITQKIHNDWILFFNKNKKELDDIIDEIKNNEYYPIKENIFRCLHYSSVKDIKLIILGQDPYIRKNQATGLSFSVPKDMKIPPSLLNIFKEIKIALN